MGNRDGRKITRKVKVEHAAKVNNGKHCKAAGMKIDDSVCTVKQVRNPHNCLGCREFRG